MVAEVGPSRLAGLEPPPITLCDVVLVTGPWMAGVSSVAEALRERLPQHKFVESTDLGPAMRRWRWCSSFRPRPI